MLESALSHTQSLAIPLTEEAEEEAMKAAYVDLSVLLSQLELGVESFCLRFLMIKVPLMTGLNV